MNELSKYGAAKKEWSDFFNSMNNGNLNNYSSGALTGMLSSATSLVTPQNRTGFGSFLNTASDAAIMTGNPFAIAGGLAGKAVAGVVNADAYNPMITDINNTYNYNQKPVMDIANEQYYLDRVDKYSAADNFFSNGQADRKYRDAITKQELERMQALGRFNQASLSYDANNQAMGLRNKRLMDLQDFGMPSNIYSFRMV